MSHFGVPRRAAAAGWRVAARFFLLFLAWLSAMVGLFAWQQDFFAVAFMLPVVRLASWLLALLGVPAHLSTGTLAQGHCELAVGGVTYRIIHECTGLFALLTFLALTFAYPTTLRGRLRGMLLGVPAFYAYSALRLAALGVAAQLAPAWVDSLHQYMMVLVNVGFMFALWLYWTARVVADEG